MLTGRQFNFRDWQTAHFTNIQIDMPARLAYLAERRSQIDTLKAEVAALTERMDRAEPVRFPRIAVERWGDVWPEAAHLGVAHSLEVNAGYFWL